MKVARYGSPVAYLVTLVFASYAAMVALPCETLANERPTPTNPTEIPTPTAPDSCCRLYEVPRDSSERQPIVNSHRGTRDVDERSRLVLQFSDTMESASLSEDQQRRWRRVVGAYQLFEEMAEEFHATYKELNEIIRQGVSDANRPEVRRAIVAFNGKVAAFVGKATPLFAGADYTLTDVLTGNYPNARAADPDGWVRFAHWLTQERDALLREGPKVELLVRAWHRGRSASTRIHVIGWDNLEDGLLRATTHEALPDGVRGGLLSTEAARQGVEARTVGTAATVEAVKADMERNGTTADKDNVAKVEEAKKAADVVVEVRRSVDELVDAEVELRRVADLQQGDEIEIEVVTLKPGAKDPTDEKNVASRTRFVTCVITAGWHWEVSPALVFLRAAQRSKDNTDRKKWKPTAAGILTRNYRIKNPSNWFERAMNLIDPGVGPHLTFPDMESDAVEVGMGPSLTFVNGLVDLGYGWNLTSDRRREYYFIGLDLFELYNQARSRLPDSNEGE